MKEAMDSEDQKVLLPLLRSLHGWTQEELAVHAGLDPSTVRRYEKGGRMRRKSYELIVAGTGLPVSLVETCLLPAIRAGRASLAGSSPQSSEILDFGLEARAEARRASFAALLGDLAGDPPREEVGDDNEVGAWRFVEALCRESEAVASGDVEAALKLAELALRSAGRAPGKVERRKKLEAYAWIFVGNAQRVAGFLPKSEEAFAQVEKAWEAGKVTTPVPLPNWCLPDRKASLRRHQGRFSEALELHDRALSLAPPEAAGRILLNKAFTQEQRGEFHQALFTLEEAERRIDVTREPRLLFGVRFNRVVNLLHLEQYRDAVQRLPEVRAMADSADHPLDRLRVVWLESKIAAGLGRRAEAAKLLDKVRSEFLERRIAFDAALATLELAVLYLEDGQSTEVRRIAAELAPVFAAQRVARETLACIDLFCQAAQQDTLTPARARGWLKELSRAG